MKSIADIDREIAGLEKQLRGVYSKRVAALEAEIKRSQAQIDQFRGGAAPVPEAPVVTKPAKTKGRPRKQKVQIPAAKKETSPVAVTISPEPATPSPAKKKVPARKAKQPKEPRKRTRTPTAVVEQRILDALKEAGLFGISQIEIAKKTGLGYQTVLQKLKKLPGVEKKGSGKEGRLFLKV